MKTMNQKSELNTRVRRDLLVLFQWLHVTLIIAPIYTIFLNFLYHSDCISACFTSFLFFFPVAISWILIRKLKYLWQYGLASILLCGFVFLVSQSWVPPVLVAILCFFRFLSRLRSTDSVFDAPHYAGTAVFILPFLYSGFAGETKFQTLIVCLAVVYVIMVFVNRGLTRLEDYIDLNMSMANFPAGRVGKVVLRTVGLTAVICLVVSISVILVNYSFIKFETPKRGSPADESVAVTQTIQTQDERPEWMDIDTSDHQSIINWTVIGNVIIVVCCAVLAVGIIVGVYKIVKSFGYTKIHEKNDIIESIINSDDSELLQKDSKKISFFDFTPNAIVRKKYKKTMRKREKNRFEPWFTPSEIEINAGVSFPKLHDLYEKARYSEFGCDDSDKATVNKE